MTDVDVWQLFPYPTVTSAGHVDGSIMKVHPACRGCVGLFCLETDGNPGELLQCRFGITHSRIDENRVLVGVVATDLANPTSGTKKRIRKEASRRVPSAQIVGATETARLLGPGVSSVFESSRKQLMEEMKSDPDMQRAIAAQFRREAEDNLNQSHDFMQLVKLVRGYAESLLHEKYPTLAPEDAAEKLPVEGSIYFSTVLMTMKIDSLLFVSEINRANGNASRVKLHSLVLKYLRIYNWSAKQKNLKIALGETQAYVHYNPEALGAVVQGFLDNLVKYAPAGSRAAITFHERDGQVRLQFESLGPRIEDGERGQIFMPRYRGRAARKAESAGQGVGLAAVKQVSDVLNLNAEVVQEREADAGFPQRYSTTFFVTFKTA